jgi:hypothetical protein
VTTGIAVYGLSVQRSIFSLEAEMRKNIEKFHESLGSIGVALEALLGSLLTAVAVATILRLASGKW